MSQGAISGVARAEENCLRLEAFESELVPKMAIAFGGIEGGGEGLVSHGATSLFEGSMAYGEVKRTG